MTTRILVLTTIATILGAAQVKAQDPRDQEAETAAIFAYETIHGTTCTVKQVVESVAARSGPDTAKRDVRFQEYLKECLQVSASVREMLTDTALRGPDDCSGVAQVNYGWIYKLANADAARGPCGELQEQLASELKFIKNRDDTPAEVMQDPSKATGLFQKVACYVDEMIRLTVQDQREQTAIEKANGRRDPEARRELASNMTVLQRQKRECAAALKARNASPVKCSPVEDERIRDIDYGNTCNEVAAALRPRQ